MTEAREVLEIDGREVSISNPDKIYFPEIGATKMDLVRYYVAVAPGAVTGCRDRPTLLKRFPDGVAGDFFFQKRVPAHRPEWIETVTVHFPSGRSAEFLTVGDAAHLLWAVNLGCLEMNPWPVRRSDVDHPDELRIDLDPTPNARWADVRRVAMHVRDALAMHGLVGYPKTSGSRGMHINARIEPRWTFTQVRRAALALGREIEHGSPSLVTTAWWKEERTDAAIFVDYNQNARDRTVASAYSVRPTPDARVSCPLDWDEVVDVEPEDFTIRTVPQRFAERGDPGAGIDGVAGSLEGLLELADRQERDGMQDAPWPPHFAKGEDEPPRVRPSARARARAEEHATQDEERADKRS